METRVSWLGIELRSLGWQSDTLSITPLRPLKIVILKKEKVSPAPVTLFCDMMGDICPSAQRNDVTGDKRPESHRGIGTPVCY